MGTPQMRCREMHQSQTVTVLDAGGQLRQVPVKTGIGDANYVEVVSGDLTEGQQVVVGTAAQPGAATSPSTGTGVPRRTGL